MGAAVSKAEQDFHTRLTNKLSAKCPTVTCANTADMGRVVISGRGNTVRVKQKCYADSKCALDAALDAGSQTVAEASSSAKAGIGIAASDTRQKIKTELENQMNASCGTTEAINTYKDQGIKFTSGSSGNLYEVIQLGDAKSNCQMNLMNKLVQKLDAKATSEAAGLDPTMIIALIAVVVVVFLLMGVFVIMM